MTNKSLCQLSPIVFTYFHPYKELMRFIALQPASFTLDILIMSISGIQGLPLEVTGTKKICIRERIIKYIMNQ